MPFGKSDRGPLWAYCREPKLRYTYSQSTLSCARAWALPWEEEDEQISTSGKRQQTLKGSIRPCCDVFRICATDGASGRPWRDFRFPNLQRIFCALRRLDLHADRKPDIPQAVTNWVPTLPEAAAQPLFCPSSLNLGNQFTQCFSFSCDSETYINNVPVVTCHCAIGVDVSGNPTQPHTSFVSQAGQGDQAFCFEHPVGNGPGVSP